VSGNVIIIDNAKEEHATEKSLDQKFKVKQREGTNNWIIVMRIQFAWSFRGIHTNQAIEHA
jgi:hypothetical protein